MNSQRTPKTSTSQASSGVSFVTILEKKNDHVIKRFDCKMIAQFFQMTMAAPHSTLLLCTIALRSWRSCCITTPIQIAEEPCDWTANGTSSPHSPAPSTGVSWKQPSYWCMLGMTYRKRPTYWPIRMCQMLWCRTWSFGSGWRTWHPCLSHWCFYAGKISVSILVTRFWKVFSVCIYLQLLLTSF